MEEKKLVNDKKIISRKIIYFLSIILFAFFAFLVFLYFIFPVFSNKQDSFVNKNINNNETGEKCENCVRRFIDGIYVEKGQENLRPFAVMIDNHVDARPSAGLSEANLVYEAEAEGRITRYLAIFVDKNNLDKIGPIRSARPYFVDWAQEFSALFVHCGGSPEALVKIIKEGVLDLNEFYNGPYFWREKNRSAPHNIFTSSENMHEYIDNNSNLENDFFSWKFKDEKKHTENEYDSDNFYDIEIDFKRLDFAVQWKYDIIKNEYLRYLGGKIHKCENENEIKVKNVIVQKMETEVIDEKLRLKIKTIGEGDAIFCIDGECREGKWKKNSAKGRTRYYYENDEEVGFNVGKTWVEVVRPDSQIIF